MKDQEYERVFLVRCLPEDVEEHKRIEIQVGDFYDSNAVDALKIRRKGKSCELIKKEGTLEKGRTEHRIPIKKEEFDILFKATSQNHFKVRYFYPLGDYVAEIDLYKGRLDGYVRVEVEFPDAEAMRDFKPPEWFGAEITRHNHAIHENLGIISFDDMKARLKARKLTLSMIKVCAR
jgi:CYTH domain-containing protein